MASLVAVDTDLIIDYLRGRGAGTRLVRTLIVEGRLRTSAVTAFELRVGADLLARRDDVLRLLRTRTVPLDLAAALRAGEVASTLQRSGQVIGVADTFKRASAYVTTCRWRPDTASTSAGSTAYG